MKIFFILFLLVLFFSLHASDQGYINLPDDLSATFNNDSSFTSNTDQEEDLSLKEKPYTIISRKNSSSLMMLDHSTSVKKQRKSLGEEASPTNFSVQQRRTIEPSDPSPEISRNSNQVALSENTAPLLLQQQSSPLFKTLIHCPGCKQWHTGLSISKKPLPQILFMWSPQTHSWHPLYREDQESSNSLFQIAASSLMGEPFLEKAIESRAFQLITSSHDKNTEILYHTHPMTGLLEKSELHDPINALPSLSYASRSLLQTRSRIPDSVIHFFLICFEEWQNRPARTPQVLNNERTLLLPKSILRQNYSSITPKF